MTENTYAEGVRMVASVIDEDPEVVAEYLATMRASVGNHIAASAAPEATDAIETFANILVVNMGDYLVELHRDGDLTPEAVDRLVTDVAVRMDWAVEAAGHADPAEVQDAMFKARHSMDALIAEWKDRHPDR